MAERDGPGRSVDAGAVDVAAVDAVLVDAIQAGRLHDAIGDLRNDSGRLNEAARLRVREAIEAIEAIDASVDAERERLTQLLAERGIPAIPSGDRAHRPLHVVSIEVARADVADAAIVITSAGYRRLGPAGDAAWRAIRATRRGCTFIRVDDSPFRVELSWTGGLRPGLASRLLTPHDSDFAAVAMPRLLWPAYSLIHVLRLPVRRWWRPAPELGPFLTTPTSLIEPLLRFGGLGPDDLLVDLGCGDARILVTAVEAFGCRARGVDADPELVALARAAVRTAGLEDRVEILQGDLLDVRLDDAQLVVAFLPVGLIRQIVPVVLGRLAPGARLVVHEQERLSVSPPATASTPLVSAGGISVAHRWQSPSSRG